MNNLTKFTQISFLIPAGSDVQKTVSFYEKLGFQVTHKEKDPPRMAVLERDCAVFYLCHENYQQLGQPINIRILVNNIDLFYQECLREGVINSTTEIKIKPWGTKELEIIAPMSVYLVFYTFDRE
ncbi:MAG: VOC family protein [Prochloraceae cyanobacterium]|nr:VOC family protein [Prochloraceae cyanobacterium]